MIENFVMPKVSVRLSGRLTFVSSLNNNEIQVELSDGSTLKNLIEKTADIIGGNFKDELTRSNGEIKTYPMVGINGRLERKPYGWVQLQDGDQIVLFLPVGGG